MSNPDLRERIVKAAISRDFTNASALERREGDGTRSKLYAAEISIAMENNPR